MNMLTKTYSCVKIEDENMIIQEFPKSCYMFILIVMFETPKN